MNKTFYFFDSYAIFELIKGNKNYLLYSEAGIITTKLNLFEVYYGLLRDIGENAAGLFIKEYYKLVIDFDMNIIEEAAGMKLKYKNRNLSMTDCIGYCLAQQWGIRFLTGDKEFEGIVGVEFVK